MDVEYEGECVMKRILSILLPLFLFFAGMAVYVRAARIPSQVKYGIRLRDEGAAPDTPPSGYGELYVNSDAIYFKTDSGVATNLLSTGATAWDDIDNPDAATTLTMSTYATIFTGAKTDGDQVTFRNTSAFGDYSIVKIQQLTGNATNGTVLTATAADTNVDGLVVSNSTADLTANNYLCTLSLTDDGDANGIFLNCLDNSGNDAKFTIAANGATTIAGSAAGADAIIITAGDITLTDGAIVLSDGTNGDITSGDDITVGDDLVVTDDASVGGDLAVTGAFTAASADVGTWKQNAIVASSAGATLTVNGDTTGGVNIGSVSTGGITLGAAVTVADAKDVTIGEGKLTIDDDQNESALVIEASHTTTGNALDITTSTTTSNCISVTADDLGTGGKMLYLDSDNTAADNYYLYLYDGAAADFTIGQYGAAVIAGNASTDVLTVTAGDIQITSGDIDLDSGFVAIDTAADQTTYIKRNQGATTGPVVTIWEAAAAADNAALLIDQDATDAGSYGLEIDTEGGTAINLPDLTTTGNGITVSTVASYTGQILSVADTLVGTNAEGIIDIKTTANQATGSTLLRLDADTGTLVGATSGFLLSLDDDSGAQATSYALNIESASNEALRIGTGTAYIVETLQIDGGLDLNEDVDIDFDNADEEVSIVNTAEYGADGAQVTIENTDADVGAAMYLLRMRYTDDGQANADFMVLEDNNGDDQFSVSNQGATVIAGAASTDMLTVTAGDVQITDGDIDLDSGFITIDTADDETSSFAKNNSGGTGAVVTMTQTHAAGQGSVLDLTQAGTGNCYGQVITHNGDYSALYVDASAASDGDVIEIPMANRLDERALNISGAITGTAGEGVIEVHATGNIADGAALVRIDADTGTPAGTTNGFCLFVDDDTSAQASSYAVEINSDANGGLYVSSGAVLMADSLTVNGAQIVGDGATEMVGVKHDVVSPGATNPYTVTIAMSGTVFYNSEANQSNLPDASTAVGTEYTFVVTHASNFDVNPIDTNIILAATNAYGDMLRSTTAGDTVTLLAVDPNTWVVKSMYPASTDWADAN